jgi:hypothetical protein
VCQQNLVVEALVYEVTFFIKSSDHPVRSLFDFMKLCAIWPGQYDCVHGKVDSADKLYRLEWFAATFCQVSAGNDVVPADP